MTKTTWMKKAIAGISAVATLAAVTPAMAMTETSAVLKSDSVLTAVVEGDTQYILGPAVDGGWNLSQYYTQFEGGKASEYCDGIALTTGFTSGSNVAVVKGDILGKGSYNISQLVTLAKLMGNPSGYSRAQQMAADIDGNGSVNISDLVRMAKKDIQGVSPDATATVPAPEIPAPAPSVEATPVATPAPVATPEATPAPVVTPAPVETPAPAETPAVSEDIWAGVPSYYRENWPKISAAYPYITLEEYVQLSNDDFNALLGRTRTTRLDKDGHSWYNLSMRTDTRIFSLQEMNEQMLLYVNDLREQEGVAPVRLCPQLMQVANVRATEMVDAHMSEGHDRPDGSLCFTAMEGGYFAENSGTSGGESMADALLEQFAIWNNCPGHHHNMVNSKWTTIGFAMVQTSTGEWTCVQVFSDDSADNVTWIDEPILGTTADRDNNTYIQNATQEQVDAWLASDMFAAGGDFVDFMENYYNK